MSDLISVTAHSEHKNHALISYILVLIGLFTAIPLLVGAVWAMLKKSAARGSIYHSHLVNVTRIFWWSLFWTIIGLIMLPIFVGYLIWVAAWVWALYRTVDGLAKILADSSYPI